MENVFLKPALDADQKPVVVPDPGTHEPLAAEGAWKPLSAYWVRRLRDGDVIQSDQATPPVAAESPPANELPARAGGRAAKAAQ